MDIIEWGAAAAAPGRFLAAARAAVADAGLKMSDIDGLCTASVLSTMWPMPVTEYLGINPRYTNGTMLGGSSFVAHILPAMMALQSGQCNAVLVCYGSTQRTSTFGRAEIAQARRVAGRQRRLRRRIGGACKGMNPAAGDRRDIDDAAARFR